MTPHPSDHLCPCGCFITYQETATTIAVTISACHEDCSVNEMFHESFRLRGIPVNDVLGS